MAEQYKLNHQKPRINSLNPKSEILGQSILSTMQSLKLKGVPPILKKYGFDRVDPDRWYSYQDWLTVFKKISEMRSAKTNLVSVGKNMAEILPSDIHSAIKQLPIPDALEFVGSLYIQQHRFGDVGSIEYRHLEGKHLICTLRIPYPDDVFFGLIYSVMNRTAGWRRIPFKVTYDDTAAVTEFKGEKAVIDITWE